MPAMEASTEAYGAEGEKARKTSGDQFKGHPEGKKPDAMFRMLAFRLAALVEKQKKELDGALGTLKEQYQETAQRALQTMLITGKQSEKDKDMRAKRCFNVKYKDGQKQCIRWILAAPAHPEFMHAMNVMKQTKIMETVQIKVEEDRATMSKAAKDIKDALKAGGSGGGSSSGLERGAERSEQGDEHSKSSAVHQDKSGAGFPGTSSQRRTSPWPGAEPSEVQLALARSLQAGVFSSSSKSRCLNGTCKHSAVGGTLARNWAVAAACFSHTVQLLSVLHDSGSVLELRFFPRHR